VISRIRNAMAWVGAAALALFWLLIYARSRSVEAKATARADAADARNDLDAADRHIATAVDAAARAEEIGLKFERQAQVAKAAGTPAAADVLERLNRHAK
jgi:hypothetical protein